MLAHVMRSDAFVMSNAIFTTATNLFQSTGQVAPSIVGASGHGRGMQEQQKCPGYDVALQPHQTTIA